MDYPGKVITKTQVTPTQTSASGNWTLDDQAAAIKNNNWPVALVPNPISKSLRFNSADSAYLNRTPASAGNANTWTWSGWVKRSALGSVQVLFSAATDTNNFEYFRFESTDELFYTRYVGGAQQDGLTTTAVFRDPSAWYHIVVVRNGATRTIYVNNVSMASGGSNASTGEINQVKAHSIGRRQETASQYFSGYMTETYMIDGQALTPSSFGMTNPQTGQWIPKKYTGTYGTNGFYLNFKDATSTTTLGYDYSGNANNWTTNNFSVTAGSGNDSLTDVPTPWVAYNTTGDVGGVVRGNYCTFNPLQKNASISPANGNLELTANAAAWRTVGSTIFVSSGKWYIELTSIVIGDGAFGLYSAADAASGAIFNNNNLVGATSTSYAYLTHTGQKYTNGSGSAYGSSLAANDVLALAFDADAGTITYYKNGVSLGQAFSGLSGSYAVAVAVETGGAGTTQIALNFGQRPFAYTPPAGFRSLCTTNLPATTIGFGLTNQGDDYFNTVLWAGNSTSGRQITGYGFAPDWVWVKNRTLAGRNHQLYDTVRGANKGLSSNTTTAEDTSTTNITAFGSDGFTVGNDNNVNSTGDNFVGWAWKASGSTVSNTAGTITSTVSANTTAGFSVVTYTGNDTSGATVGHGLGVAPSMFIVKTRSQARGWNVYHTSLGNTKYIQLQQTGAAVTNSAWWNNTSPSSTTFTLGNDPDVNGSTQNYVAYCFAAVAGYSAFGSYTGNGSTDGPFVYTGFRPRYVLIKLSSNAGEGWVLNDTSRSPYNVCAAQLLANSSGAEVSGDANTYIDILSNGFKIRTTAGTHNTSAYTYIYAAFAESPFQFSNAR